MPVFCILTSEFVETLQHLFFGCRFSSSIWYSVLRRFGVQRRPGVSDIELAWALRFCRDETFKAHLHKISLASVLFQIYIEVNDRVFGRGITDDQGVLSLIEASVRSRVISWRKFLRNQENVDLCWQWRIPERIFEGGRMQNVCCDCFPCFF